MVFTKKIICLVIFCSSLWSAEDPLSHIRPGEFVYYSDELKGCCTQVGLLKISPDQYILRVFSGKMDAISTLELVDENGKYSFRPKSGNPNEMMPMIYGLNMMNYFLYVKSEIEKKKPLPSSISVVWPAYQKQYDYQPAMWTPFFRFTVGSQPDGKQMFKLAAAGKISKADEVDTFKKFGLYGANEIGADAILSARPNKQFKLKNTQWQLDDNWELRKDNEALDLKPITDKKGQAHSYAWIQYEESNFSGPLEELLRRQLHSFECVLFDESKIDLKTKRLELTRYVGNTYLFKTFIFIQGSSGKYAIDRLTVTRDTYLKNKDYFDRILKAHAP